MTQRNPVTQLLLREQRRIAWFHFGGIASILLSISASAQGFLLVNAAVGKEVSFLSFLLILTATFSALIAVANYAWKIGKASGDFVGRKLDRLLLGSKNRFEANVALKPDAPFSAALQSETQAYLGKQPPRTKEWLPMIATALWIAILILNMVLVALVIRQLFLQASENKENNPNIHSLEKVPEPYARIDITAPESEVKATPVEEVIVHGTADSNSGFKVVTLNVSVNGKSVKAVAIDDLQTIKHTGPLTFEQPLDMDEFGVHPFDVVTYYFEGKSLHQTPLTADSQIQFIEVRPFRDDIHKMSQEETVSVEKLEWLLKQELSLSKRTWLLATSKLPKSDPLIIKEISKVASQQKEIAAKTDELFQDMAQNGASGASVDHVSLAEVAMKSASDLIGDSKLVEANQKQQEAIGQLVAATKDFIKAAQDKPPPSSVEDPFKDKQKTPPSLANNPMERIKNLAKAQQDIVQDLSKTPNASHEKDESALNKPLSELRSQPETPQNANQALSEAQDAAQKSAQQMASHDSSTALNSARSAEASMLRAQEAMEQSAQQQLGDTLAQAQSQLMDARRRLMLGKPSPDQDGKNSEAAQRLSAPQPGSTGSPESDQKPTPDSTTNPTNGATTNPVNGAATNPTNGATNNPANGATTNPVNGATTNPATGTATAGNPSTVQKKPGIIQLEADGARDLLAEGQKVQMTHGDPDLAKLAGSLADQYDKSGISKQLADLEANNNSNDGKRNDAAATLEDLADKLSTARLGMHSETENLKNTLGRLDRVLENMKGTKGSANDQAAMTAELDSDATVAILDARKLLPKDKLEAIPATNPKDFPASPATEGTHLELINAENLFRGEITATRFTDLREFLQAYHEELLARLNDIQIEMSLSALNPDESPEEYRKQVAAYYERLSKESRAAHSDGH